MLFVCLFRTACTQHWKSIPRKYFFNKLHEWLGNWLVDILLAAQCSPLSPLFMSTLRCKVWDAGAIMSRTEIVNDRIMWVVSQMKQSSNANSNELFVGLTAPASPPARFTAWVPTLLTPPPPPPFPPSTLLSSGKSTLNLILTLTTGGCQISILNCEKAWNPKIFSKLIFLLLLLMQ